VKVKGFRDEFEPRILKDGEYVDFLDAAHAFDVAPASKAGAESGYVPMEAAWLLFCERGLREGEHFVRARGVCELTPAGQAEIEMRLAGAASAEIAFTPLNLHLP